MSPEPSECEPLMGMSPTPPLATSKAETNGLRGDTIQNDSGPESREVPQNSVTVWEAVPSQLHSQHPHLAWGSGPDLGGHGTASGCHGATSRSPRSACVSGPDTCPKRTKVSPWGGMGPREGYWYLRDRENGVHRRRLHASHTLDSHSVPMTPPVQQPLGSSQLDVWRL